MLSWHEYISMDSFYTCLIQLHLIQELKTNERLKWDAEAVLTYQKFCASLSALNEMHTVHFHIPELLQMQPKNLLPVLKFDLVIQLRLHNSRSQLHSGGLHCK